MMTQTVVFGYLGQRATATLSPLWMLGLGAILGMLLIALFWGVVLGLARLPGLRKLERAAQETWTAIREGALFYVLIVACVLAGWGIIGSFLLRAPNDSVQILKSLTRLNQVGTQTFTAELPGTPLPANPDDIVIPDQHEMAISFVGAELREFEFETDQNVSVATDSKAELDSAQTFDVRADEPYTWQRRPSAKTMFGDGAVSAVYLRNRGADTAHVSITVTTDVVDPEVRMIPVTAVAMFGLFALYFLQFSIAPRLSAIALATFKSQIAQPLFAIVLLVGTVALILFIFIPYNTFGEDIKMLKDSGLTLIRVLGIFLAAWGASTTISEEIENCTALTVLSKPIGRRSFVLGKFSGIAWTTALMFVVLGVMLMAVTSMKVTYDARETGLDIPTWQACYVEMSSVVPGLVLGFMETMILASLSVAISTRLPMFANFVICFTVYVLGHLTPLIVQVTDDRFELVKFVGQLIATVFPNLEAFDLQTAMAGGLAVPTVYLFWTLIYCLLFSLIAMLLALVLFEDRDLA